MSRRAPGGRTVTVTLAAGVALTSAGPVSGQVTVAEVLQLAEVQVVGDAVRVPFPDQRVLFRDGPAAPWGPASDGQTLTLSAGLQLLDRPLSARVSVRSATGRGTLTFVPSPLDPGGARVVEADTIALGGASDGLYEFVPDTTGRADFVLALTRGAVVVDWRRGVLPVQVAGHRIEIRGTEATVALDSAGSRALAYLREGSLAVTGPQTVTLEPGQVVLLRPGLLPLVLSGVSAAQAAGLEGGLEYQRSEVWSQAYPRPLWQRPVFLGLGAVAVAGLGWCVVGDGCGNDATGRRVVTVILRLPF